MFLQSRDGIRCDLCGAKMQTKFHYFTLGAKKVSVDVTAKSTIHTSDDLDIDACQECYNKLVNRVKEVITKLGGKP